jgi:sulfatase maturation enzyme AslB (radical SAM superfamily)
MLLDMEYLSQGSVLVGVLVGALASLLLLLNHRRRYIRSSVGASVTHTAQSTPAAPVLAPSSPLSCPVPLSVNYHFTRRCNYACGFCFHTAKTSSHLPLERAKHGLTLLRARGMQKINFSGGEPLIVDDGQYLGQLCEHACSLGVFVSIVSNASLMTEAWLQQYAPFIDIIAISCDRSVCAALCGTQSWHRSRLMSY